MEKYRFDDAYEKVYKYDEDSHAYIFCGSYIIYGITSEMSEERKTNKVQNT